MNKPDKWIIPGFDDILLILSQHRYGVDRKDVGVGWVVAKAKTKKWDDTNGRIYSGCDVHMYLNEAVIHYKA